MFDLLFKLLKDVNTTPTNGVVKKVCNQLPNFIMDNTNTHAHLTRLHVNYARLPKWILHNFFLNQNLTQTAKQQHIMQAPTKTTFTTEH